jgi:outer membrane protein
VFLQLNEVLAMSVATMSKKFAVALLVLGMGLAVNASAETKIGVVNFQRVVVESPQFALVSQLIQTEFAPRQRDLQAKAKDMQAKQEKLQKDSAIMSEIERSNYEKDIVKMQRDLKAMDEALKEDGEARQNEEMQKLQNQLINEIRNYGKANGYDLVLTSSVVVYAGDAFDITNAFLTYLKGKAPETKPAAPAAGKK